MTNRLMQILTLCLLMVGTVFAKSSIEPYQGSFSRSNIVVKVEYFSQWQRPTVAAMDCTGRIKVVGVYRDTTSVSVFVKPETAVSLINGLLGIDFFGLKDTFRPTKGILESTDKNTVNLLAESTIDGGTTKITVYIGDKSHTVSLQHPAYGAPPELKSFDFRFKELVREAYDAQQ